MHHFPFQEALVEDNVVIRLFVPDIDDEELIWHWDREDRDIHVLQAGGWAYQEKGKKIHKLASGEKMFIPKGRWHRVIKGPGDLIVKVTKHV